MPKILIVDDEAPVARSMQKTLIRAGYQVETAGGCLPGFQAVESAEQAAAPFDLALLDLNMPDFDGVPTTDAGLLLLGRLHERWPKLPVVILSAYDDPSRAKEALMMGARGFNVKGREETVLEQVKTILFGAKK